MATQPSKSTSAPAETEAPQPGDTAVAPAQGAAQTQPAPTEGAQPTEGTQANDGKVSVKLAHPLGNNTDREKDTLRRLHLNTEKPYQVGQEVRLSRADARTLITAGYAQVDPEDKKAVAAALK